MNPLEAFNALTVKLNATLAAGGDTPEADDIRGEMDCLWAKMTEAERQAARDYSVEVDKQQ